LTFSGNAPLAASAADAFSLADTMPMTLPRSPLIQRSSPTYFEEFTAIELDVAPILFSYPIQVKTFRNLSPFDSF
jgi:hypothetical protein